MRIVLKVCDKYLPLLNIYAELFNKHYPGQSVDVLCFKEPKELPSNFKSVSVGPQSDFNDGRIWTDPIKKYLADIEDEYVLLLLDDLLPVGDVDIEKINLCLEKISQDNIGKIIVGQHKTICSNFDKNFDLYPQHAAFRMTTKPSIWKRKFLMKYLKRGFTIWEFESKNNLEAQRDKTKILQTKDIVFNNFNLIKRAKFNLWNGLKTDHDNKVKRCWRHVSQEDIDIMARLEGLFPNW